MRESLASLKIEVEGQGRQCEQGLTLRKGSFDLDAQMGAHQCGGNVQHILHAGYVNSRSLLQLLRRAGQANVEMVA